MKISVIVPVYNVAPYIAACLQSVMHQTCQDALECILVDDCGTDNSMEVVGEMLQSYEGPIGFKVVHHTQNRGLSAAIQGWQRLLAIMSISSTAMMR